MRVVVLISGRGSNLRALLDHPTSAYQVVGVVSNNPRAPGLEIAKHRGVDTVCIDHRQYARRADFDARLAQSVETLRPDLVVLAGFMRVLTPEFVNRFLGRLINIHPSLLPRYPGLNTHQRVLDAKDPWHGASAHYVVPELDAGPVIMQARLAVLADDTPESLAARLLPAEHELLVATVELLARQSVHMSGDTVLLDGERLTEPLQWQHTHSTGDRACAGIG